MEHHDISHTQLTVRLYYNMSFTRLTFNPFFHTYVSEVVKYQLSAA